MRMSRLNYLTKVFQDLTFIDQLFWIVKNGAEEVDIHIKDVLDEAKQKYIVLVQNINKSVCNDPEQKDFSKEYREIKRILLIGLLEKLIKRVKELRKRYECVELDTVFKDNALRNLDISKAEEYCRPAEDDNFDEYAALEHVNKIYSQLLDIRANITNLKSKKRNKQLAWIYYLLIPIISTLIGVLVKIFLK